MLSLFFDKNFWIFLACAVGGCLLVWAWIKFRSARILICTVAFTVLCGFTVYAGVYIDSYYSASGGIYGEITQYFSSLVDIEDLTFTFESVELLQENGTDTYSLTIYSTTEISIDSETTYQVCVNDRPCTNQEVTSDYCSAEFGYVFYDSDGNELFSDTLYLRFYFSPNQSCLYAYTKGGATAAEYWTQYFDRNNFVVTLVASNSNNSIVTLPSESVNYLVTYTYNDTTIMQEVYAENGSLTLPKIVAVYEWTLEDGTAVSDGYKVNENTTLYASMYTDLEQGMYYADGQTFTLVEFDSGTLIGSAVAYSGLVWLDAETNDYIFITLEGYGWTSVSKFGDYCYLGSFYADVEDVYFNSKTLSLFDFDVSMNHSLFVELDDDYIVYTTENVEGVFLLSMADMSSIQIVKSGTWTSFSSKYNEITGLWSTVLIYGSEDYHYAYDIITKTLATYSEDEVVGY